MPGEEYQDRGFWGNTGAAISGWTGQAWHAGVGAFDLVLVGTPGMSGLAQYTGSAGRVNQMYESFMFGVEENGWWAQGNIAFNPVYHLIAAGDSVMQSCGAGDWSQCGKSTFDFQMAEAEVALIAYGGAKSISVKLPGAKPPVVVTGAVAAETSAVALPELTGTIAESFEGGAYVTKTFEAGTEFYRAEAWGATRPGSFLGTEAVSTSAEAEAAFNIAKWGNPAQVMRTYRLTEDVTMYYGRVAGGEGYQTLIPRSIDPSAVLTQTGARPLG